jgi:nicotinamidase-related amidase
LAELGDSVVLNGSITSPARVKPVPDASRGASESTAWMMEPNAFLGTDLEEQLRSRSIDELVVAGMMTSMCVDATVRAAADLGFAVTVVGDGCAAPNLAYDGVEVAGEQVLAALADGYATVVKAQTLS